MLHTDDECFYVGLGHQGLGARKGVNFATNNYQPFQCCPTKVQKSTKVPKMAARRIGYDKSENTKQEQKPSTPFKFAEEKETKKSKKEEQQPVKVTYKKTQTTKSDDRKKPQSQTTTSFTPVTTASKSATQTKSSKPSVDIKGNKKRAPGKEGKINVDNGMFDDIVKKYMFW